jgi:hypothetical protein
VGTLCGEIESSPEEVVAVCYSHRDYLKEKEVRSRQEEELRRRQREEEQVQQKEDKKPSRSKRELIRA